MFQFTESVIRLSFWSTSWGANRVSVTRMDAIQGNLPLTGPGDRSDLVSPFQDRRQEDGPAARQSLEQAPAVGGERKSLAEEQVGVSTSLETARKFVQFWIGFAKTVAAAFIHGLFWCMASAIYLLLRKDVDEMEMDEIFLRDERRTYDLPPLKSDEHGIPQVEPLPLDEPES